MKNEFFKPTPVYKEYVLLDAIEKNPKVTQRELSELLGGAVSMINQYLETCEQKGYITKEYISKKNVSYHITNNGKKRKRLLNIAYLNEIQKRYKEAKKETITFINMIINKGFKDIIFYGAGEVAEILLQTINDDKSIPINIVSVIDDDTSKQGETIVNYVINSSNIISSTNHDAIMIASYTNYETIYNKLMDMNYPKDKIIYFFE